MIEEYFKKDGLLSKQFPEGKYKPREGQIEYANFISDSLIDENLANLIQRRNSEEPDATFPPEFVIVEAGTGVGKTMGYTISAIDSMLRTKELTGYKYPIVISMSSKSLQDQMCEKDIPMVLKIFKDKFDVDLKHILVKGKQNYVCMNLWERKLEEDPTLHKYEKDIYKHKGEIERIFLENTDYVNRLISEIKIKKDCPPKCSNKSCWLKKRRIEMKSADIFILNHHFYLSNFLISENFRLFPTVAYFIIDEAHQFPKAAMDIFSNEIKKSSIEILRKNFHSLIENTRNAIKFQKKENKNRFKEFANQYLTRDIDKILDEVVEDVDKNCKQLIDWMEKTFGCYSIMVKKGTVRRFRRKEKLEDVKTRISEIESLFEKISKKQHLLISLKTFSEWDFNLKIKQDPTKVPHFLDYKGMINRIESLYQKIINNFEFFEECCYICEIDKTNNQSNIILTESYIETGEILNEKIWPELSSCPVVLTSATISVNGKFDHFAKELGIKKYYSGQFKSPFNYNKQCSVFCPQDTFPVARDCIEKYVTTYTDSIKGILKANPGNTLCLFTSFANLKAIEESLYGYLINDYHIYPQNRYSKNMILDKAYSWKQGEKPFIIFGTTSFFEGVDIDTLVNVVIANIPFVNISDPYVEAKSELIKKRGGDPFMDYSVPTAIITIKQKAGRLIRNENSEGILSILDSRLHTKGYGRKILNSLPHIDNNMFYNIKGLINAKISKNNN